MSADTTIVILKCVNPRGGFEYRVALVQAADNLVPPSTAKEWTMDSIRSAVTIWQTFRNNRIFTNANKARSVARHLQWKLQRQGVIITHGCRKIDISPLEFPFIVRSSTRPQPPLHGNAHRW